MGAVYEQVRAALRELLEMDRRDLRRVRLLAVGCSTSEIAGGVIGHASAPELGREVAQAVLALPGRYREVIVLYYYENMTLREIADALRIPVNTASTRLRRGRALLGDMLKGDIEP